MVTVNVCISAHCHQKGAYNVIHTFQQMVEEYNLHGKVKMNEAFCSGHCGEGVSVTVDGEIENVLPINAREFFKTHILQKIKG